MNSWGKNINIKKRNTEPTEKEIFLDIIQTLDECWKRSNFVEREINLGISLYEEPFYITIENLIYLYYGEWKGDTILWWIFERLNEEGELLPIEITINLENQEESKTEEHLIENPEQLWGLLKKIENKSKF
jgi:hypothetical protein